MSTAVPVDLSLGELRRAISRFEPLLFCILRAEWSLAPLSDLKVTIPEVKDVPFGIRVCLDRRCSHFVNPIAGGFILAEALLVLLAAISHATFPTLVAALSLGSAIDAIAVALGVTAAEVMTIVPVVLIALAAHGTIVSGQVLAWDLANMAPNGVCLTWPALPGVAAGVINPVVGLVVLANTPVIVTPR